MKVEILYASVNAAEYDVDFTHMTFNEAFYFFTHNKTKACTYGINTIDETGRFWDCGNEEIYFQDGPDEVYSSEHLYVWVKVIDSTNINSLIKSLWYEIKNYFKGRV